MSIRKDRDGEFRAECDDCGDEEYGGTTEDFKEFLAAIKAKGWRVRKAGDSWLHDCPCCAEGT